MTAGLKKMKGKENGRDKVKTHPNKVGKADQDKKFVPSLLPSLIQCFCLQIWLPTLLHILLISHYFLCHTVFCSHCFRFISLKDKAVLNQRYCSFLSVEGGCFCAFWTFISQGTFHWCVCCNKKIVPCSHKAWDKQPKASTEIFIWQAGGRTQSSHWNIRDLKAIIVKDHYDGMGRGERKAFRDPSVGVQVLHASAHTVPCQEHSRRFYPDDSFLHLPHVCAKLTFKVTFPSTYAKGMPPPQLS